MSSGSNLEDMLSGVAGLRVRTNYARLKGNNRLTMGRYFVAMLLDVLPDGVALVLFLLGSEDTRPW